MSAELIDGNAVSEKMKTELKAEIEKLASEKITPSLSAVQVGENPASRVYIRKQKETCENLGIAYTLHELDADTDQQGVVDYIHKLNRDDSVSGIILQMPLPEGVDSRTVQQEISPAKDVEGIHPSNLGKLFSGTATVAPCTAMGAVSLLKSTGVDLKGKEVVIVGHSEIVGKPILMMMLESLAASPTPTCCHIATKDLAFHTGRADILFVACGVPGLIKGEMIKEGAIVIDIGINRVDMRDENGEPVLSEKTGKPRKKTVGDVEFDAACERASMITPVPGGVGPMTVTMLLRNTVECAKLNQ